MLRDLWENLKAWRRGERRIPGPAKRGRIFEGDKPNADTVKRAKAQASATLTMTITRADGTVEVRKVPADVIPLE